MDRAGSKKSPLTSVRGFFRGSRSFACASTMVDVVLFRRAFRCQDARVKRVLCTLLFASHFASTSAGFAEEPRASGVSATPSKLSVQTQLPGSALRRGAAAHFSAEAAHFWGCTGPCAAGGEGALGVEIPQEARSKRRRVDVVGTKDHPVLWVRWGTDEEFYSMVVIGAAANQETEGEASALPELVLKGWAGKESAQKTSLEKEADGTLTLELARESSFCGRSAPRETRVLRPGESRFVSVRASALSSKERESAERKEARPFSESENILVALFAKGARSSSSPVDGDRAGVWSEAFEFTELDSPQGVDAGRWVFEFQEPLKQPTALYFVVSEKVYQLEFLPSDARRFVVELGAENGSCIAVVQPRTPAPVVEIMGTAAEQGTRTTAELVSDLKKGEPGLVDALLVLRGKEAGREIAAAFGAMSPSTQARAFAVAERLSSDAGIPVFVRALEAGNGRSEEALSRLMALGPAGTEAVFARLKEAKGDAEGALITALSTMDVSFAASHLPLLLSESGSERRARLRDALSRLAKVQRARGVLSKWVTPEEMMRLAPEGQIELLRALEPELSYFEGAPSELLRLADSANFERAFHLAPLLVKNHAKAAGADEILSRWIFGELTGKIADEEKAALSVRVLDSLLEHGNEATLKSLSATLEKALTAENMRVRRGALLNLARLKEGFPVREERLLDLLLHDRWPQVRAAAAQAVFPDQNGSFAPRTERVLLRRLKNDPDAAVRRALARGVAASSNESIVKGVRRAFEADEDYLVRAEAAVSLGKLCDEGSLGALTARARSLGTGLTEEGPIELGLSSVTALALLTPQDINKRLAPLLSDKASRLTRQQVLLRIEAARAISGGASCPR